VLGQTESMDDQAATVEALALAVRARIPVLLWGSPGTGKTSVVRSLAQALQLPSETVIASIHEPSDFAGLPIVSQEGGSPRVDFAPPRWAQRLAAAGQGVLFFDEISTAPPAVQAALLRVVLERTVGDLELPAGIAVVAAANPPEQAASGWELSAPLANRFCHLAWEVDGRAVAEGLSSGWPSPTISDMPDDWTRWVAVARSWVGGFIRVRPTLALDVPEDAAAAGKAWPSPRSWDMAATLLAATRSAGSDDLVRSLLVRGCVGQGPGIELLTWLVEADLPDPEEVLIDPDAFVLPERGDRAFAALSSIASAVAANPTTDRWQQGWVVFGRAANTALDVAAAAARPLVRCRPAGAPVPPEVHQFMGVLQDAGLLS
jgi:hypothetical protein